MSLTERQHLERARPMTHTGISAGWTQKRNEYAAINRGRIGAGRTERLISECAITVTTAPVGRHPSRAGHGDPGSHPRADGPCGST